MASKAVYQLSARQILLLSVASAFIAVGTVLAFYNFGILGQQGNTLNVASAESVSPGISDPSVVSDEQNSVEVYRTFSPGVAFITTTTVSDYYGQEFERDSGSGSGSVIDNQGHILTNYHVIENMNRGRQKLTVSLGGDKVYPAEIVGGDPDTDLAVIKITPPREGLSVISFGNSEELSVGQKVLAIGNPFGLDRTLTTGVISGLQRPIRARNNRIIEGAIQTDASINPGNSGGPLLDKFGKMIGINSQILSPSGVSSGIGFAIPASIAKRVVPQLIQFGEVRRPKLGVSLVSVDKLVSQGVGLPINNGLLLRTLQRGGSADRAGLRGIAQDGNGDIVLGDIITAIDGQEMKELDDLYRYLDKKQIGDTVKVEIFRNGAKTSVPVKLLSAGQNSTIER